MSGTEDETIVDVQPAGGIQFPDDMVVTTSDRIVATEPEPKATTVTEPKTTETEPNEKPAWVRWTEEGGMRVEPGKGATIDANGHIILDPEVAQRMATKRVMRVRDEERARGERMVREQKERADRLEAELQNARQAKPNESSADKPWAAKGAPEPDFDDFDDVPAYTKAMMEWDRAQRAADTSRAPAREDQGAAPKREEFNSQAEHDDALAEQAFNDAYGDAMRAAIEEGGSLYQDFNDVAGPVVLSRTALAAVLEADNVPDVLYYLGSHPEEVEKLQSLDGSKLTRAIVKIESLAEQGRQDGTNPTANNGTTVSDTNTAPPKGPSHQPVPVIKPVRAGAAPRVNIVDAASQDDCGPFFEQLKARGV